MGVLFVLFAAVAVLVAVSFTLFDDVEHTVHPTKGFVVISDATTEYGDALTKELAIEGYVVFAGLPDGTDHDYLRTYARENAVPNRDRVLPIFTQDLSLDDSASIKKLAQVATQYNTDTKLPFVAAICTDAASYAHRHEFATAFVKPLLSSDGRLLYAPDKLVNTEQKDNEVFSRAHTAAASELATSVRREHAGLAVSVVDGILETVITALADTHPKTHYKTSCCCTDYKQIALDVTTAILPPRVGDAAHQQLQKLFELL
jgi:hypothetical protein